MHLSFLLRTILVPSVLTLTCFISHAQTTQLNYTVTDLSTIASIPQYPDPVQLTGKGQIVGAYFNSSGNKRVFTWDSSSGFVDVGGIDSHYGLVFAVNK